MKISIANKLAKPIEILLAEDRRRRWINWRGFRRGKNLE